MVSLSHRSTPLSKNKSVGPRESSIHLISMPHMAAEAGLVPWAERGMMHTSRWPAGKSGC